MPETVEAACPHCGERVELDIDEDDRGTMIVDCGVCCRPCQITIRRDPWGDVEIEVAATE